ncbi:MAG: tyrosine-type recombinase/integrase [Synergistaceae bacterium]
MQDAYSALDTFCSIRKAEGLAERTIGLYRTTVAPFLRNYPDFLESPRSTVIDYVTAPSNPWTRFTRIKVLKVFCKFLLEEGVINKDPLKGIKNPMPQTKIVCPEMETVQAFLKSLNSKVYGEMRLRCVILLAVDSGLRLGEICGLKRSDLDMDNMLITVQAETSKSRRKRVVPVSPQVVKELYRFMIACSKNWESEWMFPTETGEYMKPASLGLSIRRISNKTGIKLKMHGLRHLCATEFLRQTGNIALTAQLLGHTNITVTSKFYEHLNITDLQQAHSHATPIRSILSNKRIRKI